MLTVIVVLGALLTLPLAVNSMVTQLFTRQDNVLYDLATGKPMPLVDSDEIPLDMSYVNLTIVSIDEGTGIATLAISGHRACATVCNTVTIQFLSMGDDALQRRGLPPSATLKLDPDEIIISDTLTLPVRGKPSLYPFDSYTLDLGIAAMITEPNGSSTPLTRSMLQQEAIVTLQNQTSQLLMEAPVPVDPASVTSRTDPFVPEVVQDLQFQRPEYLKVLTMLLVVLITVSGFLALFTRTIDDLLLGIGGLILGVWGIRSVLVPLPLPTISAVDLALSGVILLLLIGLTVRAGRFFYGNSGLHFRFPWSRTS